MADDAPLKNPNIRPPVVLPPVVRELFDRFGETNLVYQASKDDCPTVWVPLELRDAVLVYLKHHVARPYKMLLDFHAVDERMRRNRQGLPASDFTLFYHLLSIDRNSDVRIKVALIGEYPVVRTITNIWANANWYERETWDLFGIKFEGHPNLQRILLPRYWKGHPLRKEYPARATEFDPYLLTAGRQDEEQNALKFNPEEWGMKRSEKDHDYMFLNLGPNHPSAHGAFRIVLQLDGEEIVDCVPDIGYHHRGAEKMAERQSWHTFIPYTDRIDYLGGVMNNLPYVLAVERLAGIKVPARVETIRVMMVEFFRITSHLLFLGTFIQDVGAMTPIFFMFTDRQKAYDVIEAICGFRMHPAWFRIGGVAHDLPQGWDRKVKEFLDWFPKRLDEYQRAALDNSILRNRTINAPKPSNGASPVLACVPPASTTTCARSVRIRATRTSNSRCRWAATAMPTIVRSSASTRCAKAARSFASASATCRPARTRPITR